MYKCELKVFLLSFAVFLFLATTSFGWDGPCNSLGPCGGISEGESTCGPGGGENVCNGSCPTSCATGGNQSFCYGYEGSCTMDGENCSLLHGHTCTLSAYLGCVCIDLSSTTYCIRNFC